MESARAKPLNSRLSGPLKGASAVPGDKSISHRALILSAMAAGKSTIRGLLEGEDVLNTGKALALIGVQSGKNPDGSWWVNGVGTGGLNTPTNVLDLGNSGTSTRLLMGLVGSHPFTSTFTGDASLRKRPMMRVMDPLQQMGVNFEAQEGGKLPISVKGTSSCVPITYRLPVASAQVKSAILLCALNVPGITTVIEHEPTRDHTETMLKHFGAKIERRKNESGETVIQLQGYPELKPGTVDVPGDPSSAAFAVGAALIVPGSELLIKGVCLNLSRAGFYETLKEMGASLVYENEKIQAGEKTADIRVKYSALKGVRVPPGRAPSMIDEYPILAVVASFADGKTVMEGLSELRVKESDRLAMIAQNLKACGVKLEVEGDTLTVHGNGKPPQGGASITTSMDHRIAMSFLIMGMGSLEPITIDDSAMIATSFPGFVELMNGFGAKIQPHS
jgi:3-phosphoshikimate 1-carboxyvinyltransferase